MTPDEVGRAGGGSVDEELAPVRDALLAAAREDATRRLAAARDEADRLRAAGRERARQLLAEARRGGEADAAAAGAADLLAARQQGRALGLAAEREGYERFRAAVTARLRALRGEPGYPAVRAYLVDQVVARLGSGARIGDAPDGGVVGVDGDRSFDGTLDALAERAVADFGAAVEGLWSP